MATTPTTTSGPSRRRRSTPATATTGSEEATRILQAYGGNGNDTLFQAGRFYLDAWGGYGNDWLNALNSETGCFLSGDQDNDIIEGGTIGDVLDGGQGQDAVYGNGGDDTIYGGEGDDGNRLETITAGAPYEQFQVKRDTGLYGGAGDDYIEGGKGSDFLFGGADADTLYGGSDADALAGGDGADIVYGGEGDDYVSGLKGDDFLDGGNGADYLLGDAIPEDAGADILLGGDGFDYLEGGGGADRLDGGAGEDTATYAFSNVGVVVNLKTGVTAGGEAAGDKFISIERLLGSEFADTLCGDAGANVLDGDVGADYLRGYGGNDVYIVDDAGDVVDEAFSGSGGAADLVRSYVSVNLADSIHFKGGIENVLLFAGTGLNATGNSLKNTLAGNSTGNFLNGGLDADTLTGGGGTDKFVFTTALGTSNVDRITDFAVDDRIDLENAVFTALTSTGTLASALFKNTASGAIDADDRVIYNSATGALIYDTNGSGAGGAIQFAQLAAGLAMTNADIFVT